MHSANHKESKHFLTWKGNISDVKDPAMLMGINCGEFEDCLAQNGYVFEEGVKIILLGFTKKTSLINQMNLFSPDMTFSRYGQYHTLDIEAKMSPDGKIDQLLIALSYDLSYHIFIHDKTFFYVDKNSRSSIMLDINPNTTLGHYYRIALTEVNELNPDPDYKLQTCVKESLSSQVGCRSKWDKLSHADRPECTEMEQYR